MMASPADLIVLVVENITACHIIDEDYSSPSTTVTRRICSNGVTSHIFFHGFETNFGHIIMTPQLRRHEMTFDFKFGEFGYLEGQFIKPSGIAVNNQNDLIIADINNHRVQIFDKQGRFKFYFGKRGQRNGILLYPYRVAFSKLSGNIIITERSHFPNIQIYNQYGQFLRKFGLHVLHQYPEIVTVDSRGRIIVVENYLKNIIIFDEYGTIIKILNCSRHLEYPTGVVANDKEEIFISDKKLHCVMVFNYSGFFLRAIGCYGIINNPIGIGINSNGEILIADHHKELNITIFTQEGQFISAYKSRMKHALCYDICLMNNGSVALASQDYKIYIYRPRCSNNSH